MKRLILLVALVMAMAVLAPAAFADDDAPEVGSDDVETEEKAPSEAQLWKAEMIADYFTEESDGQATEDELDAVMDLRTGEFAGHTVGWGVVFKLMLYDSDGMKGEGGWAIGQIRKTYLETHDKSDLHMNNLGQAQKAAKDKPEKPAKETPLKSQKDNHSG